MEIKEAIIEAKDLLSDMCNPTPDHVLAIETLIDHASNEVSKEDLEQFIKKVGFEFISGKNLLGQKWELYQLWEQLATAIHARIYGKGK